MSASDTQDEADLQITTATQNAVDPPVYKSDPEYEAMKLDDLKALLDCPRYSGVVFKRKWKKALLIDALVRANEAIEARAQEVQEAEEGEASGLKGLLPIVIANSEPEQNYPPPSHDVQTSIARIEGPHTSYHAGDIHSDNEGTPRAKSILEWTGFRTGSLSIYATLYRANTILKMPSTRRLSY
jgi:hypothetical protein